MTPDSPLIEVEAAGYCIDEWQRWQQGKCGTYALALCMLRPELRLGVAGTWEDDPADGWRLQHYFAHDDTHAYDSAGMHPLPYYGIHGDMDMNELDQVPTWYGLPEDEGGSYDDMLEAAGHAMRNCILQGAYYRR